jgi:hypothetical protein
MPLHMFDSLLPGHPTFAINLKPVHPDYPISEPQSKNNENGRIYLPEKNNQGRQRFWAEPDDSSPLCGLVGFFASMINTMQSWRDEIMFTYPGFRDRILQISVRPSEGGLNLNMPQVRIKDLGAAGELAAQRLIDRFHPDGGQQGAGWMNHREIRLRSFLGVIQPASTALERSLEDGSWGNCLGGYGAKESLLAKDVLATLQQLGGLGGLGATRGASMATNAPRPIPQLKLTPRI